MNNKLKVLIIYIILIFNFTSSSLANISSEFVNDITSKATDILSSNDTKELKMKQLIEIGENSVDIDGIGFYTLGPVRKNLNNEEKEKYLVLFEKYFLKSFSNRLSEYTNPKIDVTNKEVLNKNYTIVNSILQGTNERPEIKIDWRIYTKNPDNPLIRDLIIEGLSLARTQKEEFSSILASNNNEIKALFKSLEDFSNN